MSELLPGQAGSPREAGQINTVTGEAESLLNALLSEAGPRQSLVSPVRPSRVRRFWLWAPVVAYMAAIFVVSGLQTAPLPEDVSDKTGHVVAYAGLGVLAVRALAGGLPCRVAIRVAALALAIAGGYGLSDELHQAFVPERSADLADWYADLTGAFIGIGACWLWGIIAFRRRRV